MDADLLLRRFVLALAVYREARGESPLGKRLVAQTIENRVESPRWPDTYRDVVFQPWQFSSFNTDDPNALVFPLAKDKAWAECVEAADFVLENPPLTNANHYHTTAVAPSWSQGRTPVVREGSHLFFTL